MPIYGSTHDHPSTENEAIKSTKGKKYWDDKLKQAKIDIYTKGLKNNWLKKDAEPPEGYIPE